MVPVDINSKLTEAYDCATNVENVIPLVRKLRGCKIANSEMRMCKITLTSDEPLAYVKYAVRVFDFSF